MSFVVHENHGPHSYTSIHRAGCAHARPAGGRAENACWHPRSGGVYASYAVARAAAVLIGQPHGPHDCKVCQSEGDA
ncbi:MAG: hypothetical protein OXG44_20240 [Gammaproteobacteria bacterium]|nr:hypothetical protein [Gammaproteobacteria bacterium]